MSRVLVLGGTTEARALCQALTGLVDVTASLAGVTTEPLDYPCPVRRGGFGGAKGLAAYLRAEGVAALVDVTHPYARQMTQNAVAAVALTDTPLLRLDRPAWAEGGGLTWHAQPNLAKALTDLPADARPFLATGRKTQVLAHLRPDLTLTLRAIEPMAPQPNLVPISGRPPFSIEEEMTLLRDHRITHLITKNAGGTGGMAKLIAAMRAGVPIVMVDRPPLPEGLQTVADAEGAIAWLRAHVAFRAPSSANRLDPGRDP